MNPLIEALRLSIHRRHAEVLQALIVLERYFADPLPGFDPQTPKADSGTPAPAPIAQVEPPPAPKVEPQELETAPEPVAAAKPVSVAKKFRGRTLKDIALDVLKQLGHARSLDMANRATEMERKLITRLQMEGVVNNNREMFGRAWHGQGAHFFIKGSIGDPAVVPWVQPDDAVPEPMKNRSRSEPSNLELVTREITKLARPAKIAELAKATGLHSQQVMHVFYSHQTKIGRMNDEGTILLYVIGDKGSDPALQGERKEDAPTYSPGVLEKQRDATDDDDKDRDRIYELLNATGRAKPILIGAELDLSLTRVLDLVRHPWFQNDIDGISIAKATAT